MSISNKSAESTGTVVKTKAKPDGDTMKLFRDKSLHRYRSDPSEFFAKKRKKMPVTDKHSKRLHARKTGTHGRNWKCGERNERAENIWRAKNSPDAFTAYDFHALWEPFSDNNANPALTLVCTLFSVSFAAHNVRLRLFSTPKLQRPPSERYWPRANMDMITQRVRNIFYDNNDARTFALWILQSTRCIVYRLQRRS